jgi:hypothetical protein
MHLPEKYKENATNFLTKGMHSLETSKFSLYLSGSCIPIKSEAFSTEIHMAPGS